MTVPVKVTVPSVEKIPPPDPEAPSAILLKMGVVSTFNVPPLLKIPPPPLSAPSPLATFPSIKERATVSVPVLFHSPPPSEAAMLLFMLLKLDTVALVAPERCNAPPFPGFAIVPKPISTPAEFPNKETPSNNNVLPEVSSIAPPALLA